MSVKPPRERRSGIAQTLIEIGLPAAGFAWGAAWAIQDWLAAGITGLAISLTMTAIDRLDRAWLRPRLDGVARDGLRVGLEMLLTFVGHVAGALAALLVCSRLLGFQIEATTPWIALGGLVFVFPIVHGTELALRYYRQLREKERLEEKLRALATEAELKALKAQINPHFLFNTLNTIAALTHTDPEQAEVTTERLAEMLRYVLRGSERRLLPLEEELAFLDDYLAIEGARFGERLRVRREIAAEALTVDVPSLILQPLAENGVRHGQSADGRIDLLVSARCQGDDLVMIVADRGPGMPPGFDLGQSPGHGLRNVDERLRKTYGEAHGLTIAANDPQGTVIRVRVPTGAQA